MFIGIDVSKIKLDVVELPSGEHWQVDNTTEGINALLQRFAIEIPTLIVLEPSGGYEALCLHSLAQAGQRVALIHASRIRDFAKAMGKRAKNDKIDAFVLAEFAARVQPETRELPSVERLELELILGRRNQVLQMLGSEQNRLALCSSSVVKADLEAHIAFLTQQLKDLEEQLETRVKANADWWQLTRVLISVPGVGEVTAQTLVAALPELGSLSRGEVASLVGVAPFDRESGGAKRKRFVQGGRGNVRRVLYMAANSARMWNPVIAPLFERLRAAGKAFKVCMVACMRKLLVMLNAMARSGEMFDASWALGRGDEVSVVA